MIEPARGVVGLKGALHYVRAYRDRVFVVKLGGEVLDEADVLDGVAAQLALLASLGIRIVVVHGGGAQATALSRRLGIEPELSPVAILLLGHSAEESAPVGRRAIDELVRTVGGPARHG